MLAKEENWLVVFHLNDNRITAKLHNVAAVFDFLLLQTARTDFDIADYVIYPPNTNLTVSELVNFGLPASLSTRLSSNLLQ